jgi:hypothetical protein
MGLFNYVKILIPCPKCGREVGEFQTKDDSCDSLYMELVEFYTVREFHTSCPNCDTWISVKLKKDKLKELTLDDYDIVTEVF